MAWPATQSGRERTGNMPSSSGGFTSPQVSRTDPRPPELAAFQNQLMQMLMARFQGPGPQMPSLGQSLPSIFGQLYGGMGGMGGGMMRPPPPNWGPNIPQQTPGMPQGPPGMPMIPPRPPVPGGNIAPGGGMPSPFMPGMGPEMFTSPISSGSRLIRSGTGTQFPLLGDVLYR